MTGGLGLSVGATTLRAVAVGRSAVTRTPVLTLYPHRPPEVGVPSENANLAERGLIITDFVDRVGDPVAIVASDGSSHRAETLLADALRALLLTVTGGRPPAEPVGVTHPAHWSRAAIEALRRALAGLPGFDAAPLSSDALTALTALQDDPGVPTRGIIALCDVGGSGASITLADAANGFQPIGPTVRHAELSGDLVDQALLTRVVGDLGTTGALDLSSTSAIGSLSRLRGQCRAAKERLSTSAVTSMAVEIPGNRTEVRITRVELDDAIRPSLSGFIDILQDTLERSGIRSNDLVAVASVGGGARLPILTTTLSEHLRVPVITSGRPELAAAIGGGLKAVRGLVPDGVTSVAPAAAVAAVVPMAPSPEAPGSSTFRALAWSDADDIPEPTPVDPVYVDDQPGGEPFDPRPQMAFADHDDADVVAPPLPWYRRPVAMAAIGLIAVAAVIGGATAYVLLDDESPAAGSTPASQASTTAPPTSDTPPTSDLPPADGQAPVPQTIIEQAPPPPVVTVTDQPPPVTETPPPPPTSEASPPPPSPPSTEAPTTQTTQPPPSSQAPIIPTLPYQTIPGLPFVPAPIQPAQP